MTIKILVIEDDVMLAHFISQMLSGSNDYQPDIAHTAGDGLRLYNEGNYQMVLLDLSLPDGDGFAVLTHILATDATPTIVISSRDDDASRIAALAQGAEDYLTKPFHPQELLLRIGKRLKTKPSQSDESLGTPLGKRPLRIPNTGFILDQDRRLCLADGQPIELTPAEFNLLVALTEAEGKIVSHDQLFDAISRLESDATEYRASVGSLPVLVHRLRKKLQDFHPDEALILTLPRQGYRLNRLN